MMVTMTGIIPTTATEHGWSGNAGSNAAGGNRDGDGSNGSIGSIGVIGKASIAGATITTMTTTRHQRFEFRAGVRSRFAMILKEL